MCLILNEYIFDPLILSFDEENERDVFVAGGNAEGGEAEAASSIPLL